MKYRPSECPDCGFVWGRFQGRRHGRGYEKLAAGVWKCTRCGRVVHSQNGDGKRIARL